MGNKPTRIDYSIQFSESAFSKCNVNDCTMHKLWAQASVRPQYIISLWNENTEQQRINFIATALRD